MAFPIVVDDYSVLSVGGAYNLASQDTSNTNFLFQFSQNITQYPSVNNLFIFKLALLQQKY